VFQPKQWAEKEAGKTIENRTQPELVPNQASKSNIVRGARACVGVRPEKHVVAKNVAEEQKIVCTTLMLRAMRCHRRAMHRHIRTSRGLDATNESTARLGGIPDPLSPRCPWVLIGKTPLLPYSGVFVVGGVYLPIERTGAQV
jgi:hypothetical protein